VDPTPIPHEAAPGLPASWTLPGGHHPVYAAAHGPGDTLAHTADAPHQPAYGHGPTPTSYEHTPTHSAPGGHTHTPDTPHHPAHESSGGHADDTFHGGGHEHGGHGDHPGHADDGAHAGDHPDLGHEAVDSAVHHGTDASPVPEHAGADVPGHGGPAEPFEYKPSMSDADFDNLSNAEKHAVAEAELARGTNPAPSVSNEAGLAYGNSYWNQFLDDLSPESRQALRTYSGNDYDLINSHLRFGDSLDDSLKHTIAEMDKVMDTRPVPEDMMIVRGTGVDHIKVGGRPIDTPLDMLDGTFDDKAFTSTALGRTPPPPFDGKPVWMHLRVPKGTPALWIDHLSKYPGERELLLARGSEYTVTRVFFDEAQNKWHIYGEVLPRPKP
jgi:hypothetical protein